MRIWWAATVEGANAIEMRDKAKALWDEFCGDVPIGKNRSNVEIRSDGELKTMAGPVAYRGIVKGWVDV